MVKSWKRAHQIGYAVIAIWGRCLLCITGPWKLNTSIIPQSLWQPIRLSSPPNTNRHTHTSKHPGSRQWPASSWHSAGLDMVATRHLMVLRRASQISILNTQGSYSTPLESPCSPVKSGCPCGVRWPLSVPEIPHSSAIGTFLRRTDPGN